MGKKHDKRKVVSLAIALALVCGTWMPVLAGEGDEQSTVGPQTVSGDNAGTAVVIGNIDALGTGDDGLQIEATEGKIANVTVGSVVADADDGISIGADDGTVGLTVNGDIDSRYGIYYQTAEDSTIKVDVNGSITAKENSLLMSTSGKTESNVTVNGDLTAGGNALDLESSGTSVHNVTVTGDVTSEGNDNDAIDLDANDESAMSVDVTGNVSGVGGGIDADASGDSKLDVDVTGGVSGGNYGIDADAYGDSKIDVDVTGENANVIGGDAISASAYGNAEVNITVEGDVEGTGRRVAEKEDEMIEDEMPEDEEGTGFDDGIGIDAEAYGEGTVNVTVSGDVTGNFTGIRAEARGMEDGFVVRRDDEPLRLLARAVPDADAPADDDEVEEDESEKSPASVNVDVSGDVTAGELGVNTSVAGGATIDIHIGGNLTSSGNGIQLYSSDEAFEPVEERPMLRAAAIPDGVPEEEGEPASEEDEDISEEAEVPSSINVTIDGDVTAENYGVIADLEEEGSTADILINGTLSAGACPVLIAKEEVDAESGVTLTVWKIVPGEDGVIAKDSLPDTEDEEDLVKDENFEKSIQYIIKMEQPEKGGTLSIDGVTTSHDLDVAREGEKVLLKVDLEEGFKITGAYNGLGEKVALVLDDDGNYYVIVPRGGGVYLSVTLDLESYKVVFEDEDGNPLEEKEVPYGETPTYTGPKPTKEETEGYTYEFEGWNIEPSPVTGDITYKAVFNAKAKVFDLTFDLGGGTLDGKTGTVTIQAEYGSTIKLPAPTKDGSVFGYWKGSQYEAGAEYLVTGPHAFTAVWEKVKGEEEKIDDSPVVEPVPAPAPATEETTEADPTATPTPTTAPASTNGTPKTGDVGHGNEMLGMTLMITGLAVLAFAGVKALRRREEEC